MSDSHTFRSVNTHSHISSQMSRNFSFLPSYHLITVHLSHRTYGYIVMADDILAMLLILRGEHFRFLNVNIRIPNFSISQFLISIEPF